MKFQLGLSVWRISGDGSLTVVVPCGNGIMLAVRVEMFDMLGMKTVSANVELYQRGDISVEYKVRKWINPDEEESTNN